MHVSFTEREKQIFRETPMELEEGEYMGELIKAEAKMLGKDTEYTPNLCLTYLVQDPPSYKGMRYTHFLKMVEPLKFLKDAIKTFGISKDVELDRVEASFQSLEGVKVDFRLKANGKYLNCYVRKVSKNLNNDFSSNDDEILF